MSTALTGAHIIGGPVASDNGQVAGFVQVIKTDNDADNGIIQAGSNNVKSMFNDTTSALSALRSSQTGGGSISAEVQSLVDNLGPVQDKLVAITRTVEGDHNETSTTVRTGIDNVVDFRSNSSNYIDSDINRVGNLYTGLDNAESGFGFAAFTVPAVADEAGVLNLFSASFTESDGTRTTFVALRRSATGVLEWNNRTKDVPNTNTHNVEHTANFAVSSGNTSTLSATNLSFSYDFPTISDTIRTDSVVRFHARVQVIRPSGNVAFTDGVSINRDHLPADGSGVEYDDVADWTDEGPISIDGRFIYFQWRITGAANARKFEWRINTARTDQNTLAGYRLNFERAYISYFIQEATTTAGADDWNPVQTSSGDWTGSTAEYRVGYQIHPANPSDHTSHSEGVPVVYIPSTGTTIQFNDNEYTALNPVEFTTMAFGEDSVPYKFFTNDVSHNLTHATISNLLRNHWADMWALGYVSVRSEGTDTRVSGDLDVAGNVDITGSYMINGVEISTGGGDTFPSDFETETGTTIAMDASHVGKIVATTSSSAKTYNVDNSLGSDGDIVMLQNSGSGVLTVDNPLSSIDDVVVATDSTVILRKFTQSGIGYWYHTAIARPTDATSAGGGYTAPTLPSSVQSRTNAVDGAVPSSWVGNINNFTATTIVSAITMSLADSTGSDGDFITFRTNQTTAKVIRSTRAGTPVLGVVQDDGDLVLQKISGRWYKFSTVSAEAPVNTPFVASNVTNQTIQLYQMGQIVSRNTHPTTGNPRDVTSTLPSGAGVGWNTEIHKDANDDNQVRVQVPVGDHFVGRGADGNTGRIVNVTQDYIDLRYANDAIRVIKANRFGWWQPFFIGYKAFEPITQRIARTLTTTSTNAVDGWVRAFNAVSSTVANRTVVLPTTLGRNGDKLMIANAGAQTIRVTASDPDASSNATMDITATDTKVYTFRKMSGRWYEA